MGVFSGGDACIKMDAEEIDAAAAAAELNISGGLASVTGFCFPERINQADGSFPTRANRH